MSVKGFPEVFSGAADHWSSQGFRTHLSRLQRCIDVLAVVLRFVVVCERVSAPVRAEGSSLGLPDGPAAAHQSAVRPLGHAGSTLDGETRL